MTTTPWTRDHLAALADDPSTYIQVIADARVAPMLPGVDFWDLWPVRQPDGTIASVCGSEVWAGLSAPALGHPGARHDSARIRLVRLSQNGWEDLGPLFPARSSAGSREWAGSVVLDPETGRLLAYYTAAGQRGEPAPTFRQRIMGASATVQCSEGRSVVAGWTEHRELVVADGVRYLPAAETTGDPGFIEAFRDPFFFRDPGSQRSYLLFTGSMADSKTDFNGCVGVARAHGDDWELLDPLITADGVNNELERPHVIVRDGRYYLFFSTQQRTFHPEASGPTGLYGFVGHTLLGPYEPLNRSGLVLRNPPEEPFQAYSWLVLNDLRTESFVDSFALHGRHPDDLEVEGAASVRQHFGGTMAPTVRLFINGARAGISSDMTSLVEP
jgi:levansucrase